MDASVRPLKGAAPGSARAGESQAGVTIKVAIALVGVVAVLVAVAVSVAIAVLKPRPIGSRRLRVVRVGGYKQVNSLPEGVRRNVSGEIWRSRPPPR